MKFEEADVALAENPMVHFYFKNADFSSVWTEIPTGELHHEKL
jgi:hypothetical protein